MSLEVLIMLLESQIARPKHIVIGNYVEITALAAKDILEQLYRLRDLEK
jgi:hypothetical protein